MSEMNRRVGELTIDLGSDEVLSYSQRMELSQRLGEWFGAHAQVVYAGTGKVDIEVDPPMPKGELLREVGDYLDSGRNNVYEQSVGGAIKIRQDS